MPTTFFRAHSHRPTVEEAQRLAQLRFPRTWPSTEETGRALVWTALGLALIVVSALMVWGLVTGRSEPEAGSPAWATYLTAAILIPAGLWTIATTWRDVLQDPRPTSANKALAWFWLQAITDTGAGDKRFGDDQYAAAVLRRGFPADLHLAETSAHRCIVQTRLAMNRALDEMKPADWRRQGRSVTELQIINTHHLGSSAQEVHARLIFTDHYNPTDDSSSVASMIDIDIVQSFIKANGYWFPYQPCVFLERVNQPS